MQVNQSTSLNFGQLKVVKNEQVQKALRNENVVTLQKMKEVGNKLQHTQFYNVLIKSDFKTGKLLAKLESTADAYFGIFDSERFKKVVFNNKEGTVILNNTYGVGRHLSDKVGKAEYNVWGLGGFSYANMEDLDILSDIALELDTAAIKSYNAKLAADTAAQAYQKEVDALADAILTNFGE